MSWATCVCVVVLLAVAVKSVPYPSYPPSISHSFNTRLHRLEMRVDSLQSKALDLAREAQRDLDYAQVTMIHNLTKNVLEVNNGKSQWCFGTIHDI